MKSLLYLLTSAAACAQLPNGSFEKGDEGWTFEGNAKVVFEAPYEAADGARLVAFNSANSEPSGVVSVSLPAAGSCLLKFDYGLLAFTPAEQRLDVEVTGLLGMSLAGGSYPITRKTGKIRWESASLKFTAPPGGIVIRFRDASAVTDGLDLLLDNVSLEVVEAAAPVLNSGGPDVVVTWKPNPENDIRGYQLTAAAADTEISQFATGTTAEITGLQQGLTYQFTLVAVNTSGMRSAPSPATSYTVVPPAPVLIGWKWTMQHVRDPGSPEPFAEWVDGPTTTTGPDLDVHFGRLKVEPIFEESQY